MEAKGYFRSEKTQIILQLEKNINGKLGKLDACYAC